MARKARNLERQRERESCREVGKGQTDKEKEKETGWRGCTLTFDDSINVAHCRRQTGVENVSRRGGGYSWGRDMKNDV